MLKNELLITIFILFVGQISSQSSLAHGLLDSISETYESTTDSENIKNLYRLIDLSKKEGEMKLYAESLTYISPFLYDQQNYADYEKIIALSLEIAKDTSVVSKELYTSILNNAALLEFIKGNYMKSKVMYLNTLELQKKIKYDPFELSTIYHNITACYRHLGDHENSYQTSLQELKYVTNQNIEYYINNPQEQNLDIGRAYYASGNCLKSQHNYTVAKEHFNNSISYFLKYTGDKYESMLRGLINSYLYLSESQIKLSEYEQARDNLNKVIQIQNKIAFKKYEAAEISGLLNFYQSHYNKAILFFDQAKKTALKQSKSNKQFPTIARLQMRLGDCYVELDSQQQALTEYHSGLKFFDTELTNILSENPNLSLINANSACFQLLHKKAKVAVSIYKSQGVNNSLLIAKNTYSTLLELIDKMKSSYLKDGSKYYVADLAQEVYDEYLGLLYETQDLNNESISNQKILNLIEKNKATVLFSSIEKKYALLSSDLPTELIRKEQELRTDIAFYTKELKTLSEKADQGNASRIKATEQKVFELSENYAILNNKIKTEYPDFFELTQASNNAFTIEDVRSKLIADQIFIEYYESEKYIYSFSISKQKTYFYRQEKNEEIIKAIDGYFDFISTLPNSKTIDIKAAIQQSELIYSSIVDPILQAHVHPTDLMVVMDGTMSKLPLESLLIKDKEHTNHDYFIKTHEVTYFYSIRQLITSDTKTNNDALTVLALAPTFGVESSETRSCNVLNLKSLPFAQDELNYLSNNFNGSFLSNQLATTDTLIKGLGNFSVIHLATHACLNSEEPMLNQIHLADGTLTNYDIMNLNVSPDLVVLSACNTAQGDYKKGEGIISLSRGFFEAGVKSMQSALWEMNDYSSSKIVKGMYENLKQGQRKSSALRASKLEYIESAEKIKSHPYFWAGMIQIGNDEAIIDKNNFLLYVLLGGLFILGLLAVRFFRKKN